MASSEASIERTVPVVLLALGLALYAAIGFLASGAVGAGVFLLLVAVQLVGGVPLSILACFITARILGASFGYLRSAILKLAAIIVLSGAVGTMIPLLGGIVSLAVYWGLLAWLFELEFFEVLVLTIVLWIVNIVVIGLAGAVFAALH